MISKDVAICPRCVNELKYYDAVKRIVITKGRILKQAKIRRLKCVKCGSVHRELPGYIFPYKHYEAKIIKAVLKDIITSDTLGFEDYPCELTMIRWKTEKSLFDKKP